jgi:hypothetical protein
VLELLRNYERLQRSNQRSSHESCPCVMKWAFKIKITLNPKYKTKNHHPHTTMQATKYLNA